jgi:sugar phosphate isomerase/epimerase
MSLNRREVLRAAAAVGAVGGTTFSTAVEGAEMAADEPFGYCLNTSTIRGQNVPIEEEVAIAAEAGYQGIEPWINEIDNYVERGKSLRDLRKRIADAGLKVESVIGFFDWAVDDDARRAKGFVEARRNMELAEAIGGKRIAAPPSGATDHRIGDLRRVADRYRALIELGEAIGVVPEVEVWGFSKTLTRLGEAALVAVESGHPSACILADVYHLHKGGSRPRGIRMLAGSALSVFHFNDYPADPPRETIDDAQRVYPGDGVAPLGELIRDLRDIGFRGMLSLELFNRGYWKQDARAVARTGVEKMRKVVREALAKS